MRLSEELDDQADRYDEILNPVLTSSLRDFATKAKALEDRVEELEGMMDIKLPCDVKLPPRTTVREGVSLGTLLKSIESRMNKDYDNRIEFTKKQRDDWQDLTK